MSKLNDVLHVSKKLLHDNTPAILAGVAISGTVTTAYLAAKGAYKASKRISTEEFIAERDFTNREKFEETWDLYVPAVASGVVTIGCIAMSLRVNSKRTAAAYALAAISERTLDEYKEKVIEVIGEKKEQKIRDEVAQDRVSKNPPGVILESTSGVLCCELFTGRYFNSSMEALRKAQNDINARVVQDLYVSVDEFYYIVGLQGTSNSGNMGWDSHRLMELEFTTVLTPDGKPCLAFDYNYIKSV
jgi:hypothetical protein